MLYDDYMLLLSQSRNYENQIKELREHLGVLHSEEDILTKTLSALEATFSQRNNKYIQQALSNESSKIFNSYNSKIQKCKDIIDKTNEDFKEQLSDNLSEIQNSTAKTLLKHIRTFLDKNKSYVESIKISNTYPTPLEDLSNLSQRYHNTLYLFEHTAPDKLSISETVSDFLSLKHILKDIESPTLSLGIMTGYIVVLSISVVVMRYFMLLGFLTITVISLVSAFRKKSTIKDLVRDYYLLQNSLTSYTEYMNKTLELRKGLLVEQNKIELANALIEPQQKLQNVKNEQKLKSDVSYLADDDTFRANALSSVPASINKYRTDKQELSNKIKKLEEEISDLQLKLNETLEQKAILRKQIEDELLLLTTSKSKLLDTNFCFGFKEDEELLTMNLHNSGSVIFWSGSNPLSNLITNIFMQASSKISPASLDIIVYDPVEYGSNLVMFNGEDYNQDGTISIVSNNEDLRSVLNYVSEDFNIRFPRIKATSPDIYCFNTKAIETKSLTLGYTLLFIRCLPMDKIDLLVKLFKTSFITGIIPIVFVSMTEVASWKSKGSMDNSSLEGLYKFLSGAFISKETISTESRELFGLPLYNWFRVDTDSDDVFPFNERQSEIYLNDLNNFIKSNKR